MTAGGHSTRDRAGWAARAALAVALTLWPGAAASASAGDVAGIFRQVCLEHLPDFSGSEAVLDGLGFEKDGDDYTRDLSGEDLRVSIGPPDKTIGKSCTLSATLSREEAITPVLAEIIAEMTDNHFRHKGIAAKETRMETFNWRLGELEVVVLVAPEIGRARSIMATTGEVDR